jgi:hypothetical protein
MSPDDPVDDRCRFAVKTLALYASALREVRASAVGSDSYPYGM